MSHFRGLHFARARFFKIWILSSRQNLLVNLDRRLRYFSFIQQRRFGSFHERGHRFIFALLELQLFDRESILDQLLNLWLPQVYEPLARRVRDHGVVQLPVMGCLLEGP